jgi:hypothetical protein
MNALLPRGPKTSTTKIRRGWVDWVSVSQGRLSWVKLL